MPENKIAIHEFFSTFQGEGNNMGKAAFFIRTQGCPLHCPWCDSAGTWHPNHKPENVNFYTVKQIAQLIADSGLPRVVITGGEPLVWDWSNLPKHVDPMISIAVETSGSFDIKKKGSPPFDFITVSPKWSKLPLKLNLNLADEIKIIVEDENSINAWIEQLEKILGYSSLQTFVNVKTQKNDNNEYLIWLHPEWSQRKNPAILNLISRTVKYNPRLFKAGYQIHKLYQVDSLDENSAAPIPLGGNEQLGY